MQYSTSSVVSALSVVFSVCSVESFISVDCSAISLEVISVDCSACSVESFISADCSVFSLK